MRYDDFTIRIKTTATGGYDLEVVESPCGDVQTEDLETPGPEPHVTVLDARLGKEAELEERGEEDSRERLPKAMQDLKRDLGIPLAEQLFVGSVRDRFLRSLEQVEADRGRGLDRALRLRLIFGQPGEASAHDLIRFAPFPWEYVTHPETRNFLALSRFTPLLRTFSTAEAIQPLQVTPPLKVLLVMSTPKGLRSLNLAEERRRILARAKHEVAERIRTEHQVDVQTLEDPTFDRVVDELRYGKYHIFHFMGHGGFDRGTGTGELYFVDNDGGPEAKTGPEIAYELAELRHTLKLVVLNACRGGQITRHQSNDPFGSIALGLAQAGIQAVVAMQYPISDRAAIIFGGTFYQEIRAGAGVDEALTEARREIGKRSAEWGTPVLYLRPKDGRIFALSREEDDDRGSEEPALRLGLRSVRGWGGTLAEKSDYFLDLTSYFEVRGSEEEARFIRQESDWNASILPRIDAFFRRFSQEVRPLELIMPAHASVAFAAGYVCEVKAGQVFRLQQRGARGTEWWSVDDGAVPAPIEWRVDAPIALEGNAPDVAVVVGVARDIVADVVDEVSFLGLPLHRVVSMALPTPGQLRIANGAHAWALAESIAERIRREAKREAGGVLHLFLAVPNTVAFFLGRLARPFGRIQLYEHDFEQSRGGHYAKSIEIVPRTLGHLDLPSAADDKKT
ncbi:MAG: SAVED domain-containing protein [Thermoanaerobaculia bacterium]|nr:SAVED domain-containing protein [Thermoanaerobaculia bacterium]